MIDSDGWPEFEYQRRVDVDVECVDDEALIWDASEQAFHRLDATTTAIWNACGEWTRGSVIVATVAGSGNERPGGGDEIVECLNILATRRLVHSRPVAGDSARPVARPVSDGSGA